MKTQKMFQKLGVSAAVVATLSFASLAHAGLLGGGAGGNLIGGGMLSGGYSQGTLSGAGSGTFSATPGFDNPVPGAVSHTRDAAGSAALATKDKARAVTQGVADKTQAFAAKGQTAIDNTKSAAGNAVGQAQSTIANTSASGSASGSGSSKGTAQLGDVQLTGSHDSSVSAMANGATSGMTTGATGTSGSMSGASSTSGTTATPAPAATTASAKSSKEPAAVKTSN
jgi:cellulose 1,4-beta-cellobiosidase